MTQQHRVREFSRSALALAVCAAFAGAQAQEKKETTEEKSPIETRATIEIGAAGVTGDPGDRAFFGQYNGMRNQDAYGLFNFDYSRRDGSTGTWLDIVGSNLGLQTRELGALWSRQGDWSVKAGYNELWAVNPYTVNTGVLGTGTTTPTALYLPGGPGTGGDTELSTKRKGYLLGGSKWFGSEFQLEGSVNSEKKTGAQLFGIGNQCPSTATSGCSFIPGVTSGTGILYTPQPIDYNHTQVEARLNYAGSSLQLSGGYYGSFLTNDNGSMTPGVPSTLNNATGQPLPAGTGVQAYLGQTVALAPENQYNYFDLTGSYTFSPIVRTNFKLAYSQATQDQEFSSAGLTGAPAGIGSLDGEVSTTLAQIRVVVNPIAKLSIVGEYRYYDQEDDTPVVAYNQVATTSFTNQTNTREVNSGKLEATYRFPVGNPGHGRGGLHVDRPDLHADGVLQRHQRAARRHRRDDVVDPGPPQHDRNDQRLPQVHRQQPRRIQLAGAGVQRRGTGDRWRPGAARPERDLHADAGRSRSLRLPPDAQLDGHRRPVAATVRRYRSR